ncbi:hypothetical protein ACFSJT_08140 [Aquimarina celericrescens]|uniref:Uncharacterized protein n=1 Tax=Aquimarina celericrescens TaxID=1964542 RepID=A0ABW5AUU7_9FLAO
MIKTLDETAPYHLVKHYTLKYINGRSFTGRKVPSQVRSEN